MTEKGSIKPVCKRRAKVLRKRGEYVRQDDIGWYWDFNPRNPHMGDDV